MASSKKKGRKQSRPPAKAAGHTSVQPLLDEAERSGERLLREVKDHFETLAQRVSSLASSAADTASSVTEGHVANVMSNVVDHVKEAREASAHAIGEGFERLRQRLRSTAATAAPEQPAPAKKKTKAVKRKPSKKKVAAKKKATSGKKTGAKKKAAGSKKAGAKKKPSRASRASAKKKATKR